MAINIVTSSAGLAIKLGNSNLNITLNETQADYCSDEVIAAYAAYETLGDGLTAAEKTYMKTYIDAEVSSNNHALKDYEVIHSLSGTNRHVDYIGGLVGVDFNTPLFGVNGKSYDGINQYTDTNWNPQLGINFSVNDSLATSFVQRWGTQDNLADPIFGSGASSGGTSIIDDGRYKTQGSISHASGVALSSNNLYGAFRDGDATSALYKNGIEVHSNTGLTAGLIALDFYIASFNNNNINLYYSDCTISTITYAASLGFDMAAQNTNQRALLTSLGATI